MLFEELDVVEKYDGIWACASILHVEKKKLPDILKRMATATKNGGVIYTSFKYGDFEGEKNGRYFTYLTEESFLKNVIVTTCILYGPIKSCIAREIQISSSLEY